MKSTIPGGSKDVERNEWPTKIACQLRTIHLFVGLLALLGS